MSKLFFGKIHFKYKNKPSQVSIKKKVLWKLIFIVIRFLSYISKCSFKTNLNQLKDKCLCMNFESNKGFLFYKAPPNAEEGTKSEKFVIYKQSPILLTCYLAYFKINTCER